MNNQKEGGKSIVQYTCKNCFETWRQKDSFLKHLEICKGNGSTPKYHCNKCLQTFAYGTTGFCKPMCKKSPKSTHASSAIKVTLINIISSNMLKSVPCEVNGCLIIILMMLVFLHSINVISV